MAKTSVQFICRACGSVQSRWAGKCTDCGQWNTLEEHRVARGAAMDPLRGAAGGAGVTGAGVIGAAAVAEPPRARAINDVQPDVADGLRIATGINELDRVLGGHAPPPAPPPAGEVRVAGAGAGAGGIVPGSAILLGGDPGIGKSTLMLQAARQLARARRRVLYVTSEESAQQLQQRAERLDALGDGCDNLLVLADTNLARIIEQARQTGPAVMIVDSIQMIYKGDLPAAPGSV
ncbi:MAG: AAA family ATPase, partial [Phycisphaeraceae bacterium]